MKLDALGAWLLLFGISLPSIGVILIALCGLGVLRRLRKIEGTLTNVLIMLADHDNRLARLEGKQ